MPRSDWWPFARSTKSPLEGLSAEEQYEEIRWGKQPRRRSSVIVPGMKKLEAVVELGVLRALYLELEPGDVRVWQLRAKLTVGAKTNRLWIVPPPRGLDLRAIAAMPSVGWPILRTDYTGVKGQDDAWWYHEHEAPFPRLKRVGGSVQYSRGQYVVAPEGIVG